MGRAKAVGSANNEQPCWTSQEILSNSQTVTVNPGSDIAEAERADLVFTGVEQAGPSYEGRVFIGNPDASDATELSPENGYVGSFSVYGYGDAAPPEMSEAKADRADGAPAVAPIEKRLRVDGEVLRELLSSASEPILTVVAVPSDRAVRIPSPLFQHVGLQRAPADPPG